MIFGIQGSFSFCPMADRLGGFYSVYSQPLVYTKVNNGPKRSGWTCPKLKTAIWGFKPEMYE